MSPSKLRLVSAPPEPPDPGALGDAAPASGQQGRSFEALYARYAPYVAAVASRILGRAAEVDDVVQDVFAAAMNGLRRRDDPHEMKGWFAKVTVRQCLRQLRVRRLWSLIDLAADPSYERLADPAAGPEERQLVIEVYRALDRVAAADRVAWTLRHVEGEPLEEVAALCGCSLATAKRRVARAHEKVTATMQEKGGRR